MFKPRDVKLSQYRSPTTEYTSRVVYSDIKWGLEARDIIYFRIRDKSWTKTEPTLYQYIVPDPDNMTILAGGDVGYNGLSRNLISNVASKVDADLIMIGGDIAYDNGNPRLYRAWDYLLNSLPILKPSNDHDHTRVIPVIFTVGNHDLGNYIASYYYIITTIGLESYSPAKISYGDSMPAYKHFFPQNTNGERVPNIEDRNTTFYHIFGSKLMILSMDSGYEKYVEGEQTEW